MAGDETSVYTCSTDKQGSTIIIHVLLIIKMLYWLRRFNLQLL